jgi:hypothetical protein
MNGPYPEITNISFLAKLFFKTFISLKHLSDYRTVGLSDRRTIGLSDYSYSPINDISDKLVSLSRLFADDTSFGYSNQDAMQLKNVIDHDLNEMDLW